MGERVGGLHFCRRQKYAQRRSQVGDVSERSKQQKAEQRIQRNGRDERSGENQTPFPDQSGQEFERKRHPGAVVFSQ